VTRSKATSSMITVEKSRQDLKTLINQIQPPIDELVVIVTKIDDQYIVGGIRLCNDIIAICDKLSKALTVLTFLSLIPAFGQFLSQIVNVISRIDIQGKVKTIAQQIKGTFENVCNSLEGHAEIRG